jgi:outer membrane protein TolC
MKTKSVAHGILFLICVSLTFISTRVLAESFSLKEVVIQSLRHHPEMESARYNELSQEQKVTESASVYYPQVSGQAMIADGLPGSAAATGVEGLVVSPYHRGPVAGIIVKQTIWDFGRTGDSIDVSKSKVSLSQADTQAVKVPIVQKALSSYYSCARDKKLAAIFNEILKEAQVIQSEVDKFVKSSQRSVVEKDLAESQSAEIETIAQDSEKKYELELKRLSVLTGLKDYVCPDMGETLLQEFEESELGEKLKRFTLEESPFIHQAKAQTQLSLSEKGLAFDDHYPRIMGVAGYGYVQDTWAGVPLSNYAVAVGIVIPIFEGFRVSSRVEGARAKLLSDESHLEGIRLNVGAANVEFDKTRESSQVRMRNLKSEVAIAVRAFDTAKKRYFTYQGNLVDLRESLRNLTRTQNQLKIAEFDFLLSSAEKALVNGGLEKFNNPSSESKKD